MYCLIKVSEFTVDHFNLSNSDRLDQVRNVVLSEDFLWFFTKNTAYKMVEFDEYDPEARPLFRPYYWMSRQEALDVLSKEVLDVT